MRLGNAQRTTLYRRPGPARALRGVATNSSRRSRGRHDAEESPARHYKTRGLAALALLPTPRAPGWYNFRPFPDSSLSRITTGTEAPSVTQKLYIRTFGCQMNEYDSDKMADVLHESDGLELTDHPDQADVILFNTCSVREKAQERVFHDLGRVRALKAANPELIIGVGGCVASQEGAAIVRRAPYVDVVFGPQTLHRLPDLIARRRSSGRPQVDISFPEIEKFDSLPPARVEGASAFVSIMEGCSKYCTFCVVPYTRGEEVSRPFEDVLTEVADLVDQGVKEITLLGQNVNAYRGAMGSRTQPGGGTADLATLLEYLAEMPGLERIRYTTSHPREMTPNLIDSLCQGSQARVGAAPARAVGIGSRARRDEARLHRARIQGDRPQAARGAPAAVADLRLHRRLSRRDAMRISSRRCASSTRSASTAASVSSTARGPEHRRPIAPTRCRGATAQARLARLQAAIDAQYRSRSERMIGAQERVLVTGRAAKDKRELQARTEINRVVNFVGDAALIGTYADVTITAALGHSLRGEWRPA